jgi:hypothetical protein
MTLRVSLIPIGNGNSYLRTGRNRGAGIPERHFGLIGNSRDQMTNATGEAPIGVCVHATIALALQAGAWRVGVLNASAPPHDGARCRGSPHRRSQQGGSAALVAGILRNMRILLLTLWLACSSQVCLRRILGPFWPGLLVASQERHKRRNLERNLLASRKQRDRFGLEQIHAVAPRIELYA